MLRLLPQKMKVLLVSSGSGSRGGGEIFLDYLGQGLAERGHEITLWMPAHTRMDELATRCARYARIVRADYRNTYDHRARSLSTCFNVYTSRRLAREWDRLGPDVIHLNKQNLEDGLDLVRAAQWCTVPTVCTIHLTQTARYLHAKSAGLRDCISRRTLGRYEGTLVAVQETRRVALEEFLGRRVRTQTIFNGVSLGDPGVSGTLRKTKRRELGINDTDILVLGLGRLVEQKRPFEFLKAARELHRHSPNAKFLWVGDGELATAWQESIARENLNHVISCAGWQTDPRPFLHAGDLLLHVAEYEGLPFAILEAMAVGLPCAITRGLAAEVPLFDERSVLLFDDPVSLAAKLRNPSTLASVSTRAQQLVRNQFSISAMIDSYELLYAKVVGE
jgi:glycosyltransferase involved in cell wall biosynthesis